MLSSFTLVSINFTYFQKEKKNQSTLHEQNAVMYASPPINGDICRFQKKKGAATSACWKGIYQYYPVAEKLYVFLSSCSKLNNYMVLRLFHGEKAVVTRGKYKQQFLQLSVIHIKKIDLEPRYLGLIVQKYK